MDDVSFDRRTRARVDGFAISRNRFAYHGNLRARLPTQTTYEDVVITNARLKDYLHEFEILFSLSVVCAVWEFTSMFMMYSSYSSAPVIVGIIAHISGAAVTLWYCLDAWSSTYFVWIFILFSLVPALVDLAAFLTYYFLHFGTRKRYVLHVTLHEARASRLNTFNVMFMFLVL